MFRRDALWAGFWSALGASSLFVALFLGYKLLIAASAVATPFIAAIVVALLGDPLVDFLQRKVGFLRGKRSGAVGLVYLLFLLSFIALVVLVVPNLIEQVQRLVTWFLPPPNGEGGFDGLRQSANHWLASHQKLGPVKLPHTIDDLVTQYSNEASDAAAKAGPMILSWVVGSASGLLNVILIPLLTFYLLMDLDRMKRKLIYLLPEQLRGQAIDVASDVGQVFSNYIRGMIQVSLIYMLTATLFFFGLSLFFRAMGSYALLIGVVGGLLYVVPYIGFVGVALVASIVALVSGAGGNALLASVILLFALNQTFDNVITPRIVGGGVGLHPIFSMFALLLGANLAGLWGMLLAVPAAGSLKVVLVRLFPRLGSTPRRSGEPERRRADQSAGRSATETPKAEG